MVHGTAHLYHHRMPAAAACRTMHVHAPPMPAPVSHPGKDDFSAYYVFMAAVRRGQFLLIYDVNMEEYTMRVPVREFSATGEVERGAPITPAAPKTTGPWRFSLVDLNWVLVSMQPHDDPNKMRAAFHIPEWFAPISGMWNDV